MRHLVEALGELVVYVVQGSRVRYMREGAASHVGLVGNTNPGPFHGFNVRNRCQTALS